MIWEVQQTGGMVNSFFLRGMLMQSASGMGVWHSREDGVVWLWRFAQSNSSTLSVCALVRQHVQAWHS